MAALTSSQYELQQKVESYIAQKAQSLLDGVVGRGNALVQAREFHSVAPLTGVILTKMDGSGKGGSAVAIQHELGIPVRFVGTGEKMDDLAPFDPAEFVNAML